MAGQLESRLQAGVSRMVEVESEMDLGFAGLHQLLVPFLGGLEWLPVPQREALPDERDQCEGVEVAILSMLVQSRKL